MESFINLVDIVAWPLTLLIILYYLKDSLPGLFRRVTSLEVGSIKAEFDTGLKELGEIAETPSAHRKNYLYDSKATQLQNLAKISPSGAVIDAWREVELASISAALHNNLETRGPKGRVSGNAAVKSLTEAGVIDDKMAAIYQRLKNLRNSAVHDQGQISSAQAGEYGLVALEIAGQFREINKSV
jgi:hypothetical protein